MKIGIANDHRAYDVKEKLKNLLDDYDITDFGCFSSESVDFPKYAFTLAEAVKKGEVDLGIAICGTGIGFSIACNKVKGIRCAKVNSVEEAKLAKQHNNANVLAFGANYFDEKQIKEMFDAFVNSTFNTDPKYKIRNDEISKYEEDNEY